MAHPTNMFSWAQQTPCFLWPLPNHFAWEQPRHVLYGHTRNTFFHWRDQTLAATTLLCCRTHNTHFDGRIHTTLKCNNPTRRLAQPQYIEDALRERSLVYNIGVMVQRLGLGFGV